MKIELLLNDLVHQQVSTDILFANSHPPAKILENTLETQHVGLDGCCLFGLGDDVDVAPFEIPDEVVDTLLDDVINHAKDLGLLGLIIPGFVGYFQLKEDVLEDELYLGIVVAMVHTFFREIANNTIDDVCETDEMH